MVGVNPQKRNQNDIGFFLAFLEGLGATIL